MSLAPCPDILRISVPFLIKLCGDTRTSDIENRVQRAPIFAAESHRGQLFCRGRKLNDSEEEVLTHTGNPSEEIKL